MSFNFVPRYIDKAQVLQYIHYAPFTSANMKRVNHVECSIVTLKSKSLYFLLITNVIIEG